ncbi:MAG TPA: methyltransferase domain-containing protein [Deltaproteobacteria bacterium]|nr:methyltransferase domain-containing protein [Deltaproteobacteria bacterium]
MAIMNAVSSAIRRILGKPRQISEEEFKAYRRESLDPVTRRGACYVPIQGYESTIHYRDKQNLHHLGRYEWAVRVLEAQPSRGRVLDCACGVGYGSRKLAEIFDRVEAVDIDEQAIEMAIERYADPRIEWSAMDAAYLRSKYQPESFDAIVSMQTIESIEDDQKFLDDLHAILRPGGILLIDTPLRKFRVDCPENPHHRRYYGVDEWIEMLQSRFQIRVFGSLPEADFLKSCGMPSQGSIVHCTREE